MRAGNVNYRSAEDIAPSVPVFPLSSALLLPGGRMPLNIFEPRYIRMVDAAIGGNRLIGMVQPALDGMLRADGEPELCTVGCVGRLTSFAETSDGRYLISLDGICRFRIAEELAVRTAFRQCRILPFAADLDEKTGDDVDRPALMKAFRRYAEANDLEVDWDGVSRVDNATLVNALSMMAPYGPAEKQALLEAVDLKTRAETLVAIAEMRLAQGDDDFVSSLQ